MTGFESLATGTAVSGPGTAVRPMVGVAADRGRKPQQREDVVVSSKWRVAAGIIALMGGSVGQLLYFVVVPVPVSSGATSDQVAAAAGQGAAMQAVLWLDLLILLLIPAALYVGEVAGARRSRLAAVGTAVTFVTALGAGYLLAGDVLIYLASVADDRAGAVAMVSAYQSHGVVVFALVTSVVGNMIGFVLLGIALVRARSIPVWAGAAVAAAAVLEVAGHASGIGGVAIFAYILRIAGFAACAVALVRLRRDGAVPRPPEVQIAV
ncbi:hypothetical protein [Streptosporangium lutulentum]|uniref:DUF4386 family protein n=1 Tax=Streptosporangium lutulentum TaxID=1461250 RepID=A0ABT9Q8R6_9ACTN|nr:hypothetical protein [Streptosporangium lutulentum]MDP9843052.1 hypothetical protein [Streptosporangium lutulentum]